MSIRDASMAAMETLPVIRSRRVPFRQMIVSEDGYPPHIRVLESRQKIAYIHCCDDAPLDPMMRTSRAGCFERHQIYREALIDVRVEMDCLRVALGVPLDDATRRRREMQDFVWGISPRMLRASV